VGAKPCTCADGWVWYDGRGLKDGGYTCLLDYATYICFEDLVHFDGTGLRRMYGAVASWGENCPPRTRVFYDGTGIRSLTTPTVVCA
jgi:hypothetical protein